MTAWEETPSGPIAHAHWYSVKDPRDWWWYHGIRWLEQRKGRHHNVPDDPAHWVLRRGIKVCLTPALNESALPLAWLPPRVCDVNSVPSYTHLQDVVEGGQGQYLNFSDRVLSFLGLSHVILCLHNSFFQHPMNNRYKNHFVFPWDEEIEIPWTALVVPM